MRLAALTASVVVMFFVLPSLYGKANAQCAPGHTYFSCTINCSWPDGSSFPAWGGYCYDPGGVGSSCDAVCPAYITPYNTPYGYPTPPDVYGTPAYGTPYGTPPYGTPYGTPPYGTPYGTPPYGTPYGTPPYGTPYGTPAYGTPQVNVTVTAPAPTPAIRTASANKNVLGESTSVSSASATPSAQIEQNAPEEKIEAQAIPLWKLGIGTLGIFAIAGISQLIYLKIIKR